MSFAEKKDKKIQGGTTSKNHQNKKSNILFKELKAPQSKDKKSQSQKYPKKKTEIAFIDIVEQFDWETLEPVEHYNAIVTFSDTSPRHEDNIPAWNKILDHFTSTLDNQLTESQPIDLTYLLKMSRILQRIEPYHDLDPESLKQASIIFQRAII